VSVEVNETTIKEGGKIDWDANKLNQRLSGEWLITTINYTFNKVGGFSQELTLVRRELGFNENDFNI
jgi:hypothetical protein